MAAVAVIVLLAYSLFEVTALQGQVASLQSQNSDLQNNLQSLGSKLDYMISRLAASTSQTTAFDFGVPQACVSKAQICPIIQAVCISPPACPQSGGGNVYSIQIENVGSDSISAASSVFLGFKDGTMGSYFGFNATLPGSIAPNSSAYLQAASWPYGTNATSKMASGDSVGLSVTINGVTVATQTTVVACTSGTYTGTNGTQTATYTETDCGVTCTTTSVTSVTSTQTETIRSVSCG